MKYLTLLVLPILFLTSCRDDTLNDFDVVYEMEFNANWNGSDHPTDFPGNAHFSPPVVVSHTSDTEIFTTGLSASPALKFLAETGGTGDMEDELQVLVNLALAFDQNTGARINSPGSKKVSIGVTQGYSTVTVLSMIAPSPDWFVSATTNLIDSADGLWFDEVIVDVRSYDSGTDSGVTFGSGDLVSDPVEPITAITDGPLVEGGSTVVNMGQFIFRRVK